MSRALAQRIGHRLAITRIAVGLTQQTFAAQFGCSRSAVASWETGRTLPDIFTMMRFSAAYDVPLDWLYMGKSARLPAELRDLLLPRYNNRPSAAPTANNHA